MEVTSWQNGQNKMNATLPLRPDTYLLTDYFSLYPLLKKCSSYPLSLFVLDVKQLDSSTSTIPVQKLLIKPEGERTLTLGQSKQVAQKFLLDWGKVSLQIWVSTKDNLILQIMDSGKQMVISLSHKEAIEEMASTPQSTFFKKERALPFLPNIQYEYYFHYKGKDIGKVSFHLEKEKENYKILAKGAVGRGSTPYVFESETLYNASLRPLFYKLKEKDTEIICEFILEGVKEQFTRQSGIVECFIPLSPHFIFLDNNAMQHFAIFMSQCPLKTGEKFPVSIFHPRRMHCTEGVFEVIAKTEQDFKIKFTTPYHTVYMWLTHEGQLVRYEQDHLVVVLRKKT
jgi:hypothetical protein